MSMWGALRKDFGEFVSTVATETSETLAKIDTGLDDGVEGRGPSAALIDPDTGMVIDTSVDGDDNGSHGDDDDDDDDEMKRPDQLTVEEKKLYLMTCEAVFLDDLIVDVDESQESNDATAAAKAFLAQFDIETKTDEISKLLEEFPGTLQVTFSNLSDQVEYADFWKRYFFRLSDDQVEATYEQYYALYLEEKEAALKNKKSGGGGPSALSNVTNFLGVVVNRLVEENNINDIDNDDDEEEDEEEDETGEEGRFVGAAASTAMKFLVGVGGARRPPFVLNTAVDEDDDEDEGGVERSALKQGVSADDEELGWDDDDDDDDDDGEEEEAEETLEFNDAEKEKLQEELQQAQEERDILHKTVEMQAEEIKKLKEATQPEVVTGGDISKQAELMKMQLFEKDSELAALRAQVEDLKQEKEEINTVQSTESLKVDDAEIERLNAIVDELKAQIVRLEVEAGKAKDIQNQLERVKAERDSLKSQLTALQETSENLSSENDQAMQTLRIEKDAIIGQLQHDLSKTQETSNSSREENETLKKELQSSHTKFEISVSDANELRTKLISYEQTISQLRADLQRSQEMTSKTREAEDSDSTGVKISSATSIDELPEAPPSIPVAKPSQPDADAAGGEDDGWGDDW